MADNLGFVADDDGFQPDARGYPNPDAKTNPREPEPSIWERYISAMGRGSHGGGAVGGIVGGATLGPLGVVPGAFVGNLGGQLADRSRPSVGSTANIHSLPPSGQFPHGVDRSVDLDPEAAAADAVTQGAFSGVLGVAGRGAAKAGFPRVAGALGAKPPEDAVLSVAPNSAQGITTPALQRIDSAGAAVGPEAAKMVGATDAELARQEVLMARLRDKAQGSIGGIQSRMAARDSAELLPKTQAFSKALDQANIPDNVRREAFADLPSIEEGAIDPVARSARQDMVTAAVPQRADANALKNATRYIANAEARGVSAPVHEYAGDAAGLTDLTGKAPANNEWLKGVAQKAGMPGPLTSAASAVLPSGGLSPQRIVQTAGALLEKRGVQSVNPEIAKMLAGGPAYRASPSAQTLEEVLRAYLSRQR